MLTKYFLFPIVFSQLYFRKESHYCTDFRYFPQKVDHFSSTNDTFLQRYIIKSYGDNGFIFYTGNEGDIETFCEIDQFGDVLARENGLKIIFAEHRYYGNSFPSKNYEYQSIQQVLEDYAVIIQAFNPRNLPVISFGGSYGGMLSAWFRYKYPHLVSGALAASAPVLYHPEAPNFDCSEYFKITTETWTDCREIISNEFKILKLSSLAEIKAWLSICPDSNASKTEIINELIDSFVWLAMLDYPTAKNFLSALPAWPVDKVCSAMKKNLDNPFQELLQVSMNGTGTEKCFNFGSGRANNLYFGDLGYDAWEYQTCTELPMPFCYSDKDMFPYQESSWREQYDQNCLEKYGVTPDYDFLKREIGWFEKTNDFSNIIFTNGKLDPWRAGGISTKDFKRGIYSIEILKGAHHTDLLAPDEKDPISVMMARETIKEIVKNWLNNSKQGRSRSEF